MTTVLAGQTREAEWELATEAMKRFTAQTGATLSDLEYFPTNSSHNEFFCVVADGTKLLVKVVVDSYLAVGDDFIAHEYDGLSIAHRLGVGPEPVYADSSLGVLVRSFVEGATLESWSVDNVMACARLGHALMKGPLTSRVLQPTHLSLTDDVRTHLRALDGRHGRSEQVDARWAVLTGLSANALRFCRGKQSRLDALPLVFSHNDLSPENVLRTRDGDLLIDFEMAALSKPEFVVGQLAVDAALDDYTEGREPVRSFPETWEVVRSALSYEIADELCQARTVERLVQNAAYALRQCARLRSVAARAEYVEFKLTEADFCLAALEKVLEEW